MSWFDASTFSKYAKTALKTAQKNIDKVLDIGDEDAAAKNTSATSECAAKDHLNSTPNLSVSDVRNESDSFFNSFLGSGKKQISSYLTPETSSASRTNTAAGIDIVASTSTAANTNSETSINSVGSANSVASIDVSTDVVDTSKRRGRLKDRQKENRNTSSNCEGDDSENSTSSDKNVCQDTNQSSGVSKNLENKFIGTMGQSKTAENLSDNYLPLPHVSSCGKKDDSFDDIDLIDDINLSDNEIDITDNFSDFSNDNLLYSTPQTDSPLLLNKIENLDTYQIQLVHNDKDGMVVKDVNELNVVGENLCTVGHKDVCTDSLTTDNDDLFLDFQQNSNCNYISTPLSTPLQKPTSRVVSLSKKNESSPTESVMSLPTESVMSLPTESVMSLPTESVMSLSMESVMSLPTKSVMSLPTKSVVSPSTESVISSRTVIEESTVILPSKEVVVPLMKEGSASEATLELLKDNNVNEETVDNGNKYRFENNDSKTVNTLMDVANNDIPGDNPENINNITMEMSLNIIGNVDTSETNEISQTNDNKNNYLPENNNIISEHNDIRISDLPISNQYVNTLIDNTLVSKIESLTESLPNEETKDKIVESDDSMMHVNMPENESSLHVIEKCEYEPLENILSQYESEIHVSSKRKLAVTVSSDDVATFETKCVDSIDQHVTSDLLDQATTCSESSTKLNTEQLNDQISLGEPATTDKTKVSDDNIVNADTNNKDVVSPSIAKQCEEDDNLESILKQSELELCKCSEAEVFGDELNADVDKKCDYVEEVNNTCGIHGTSHLMSSFESLVDEGKYLEERNDLNKLIKMLTQEVKDLQSVIEAREAKVVQLSKQNIAFNESVAVYQSQIEQLEQVNKSDDEEMENMRQEFTKRIAESDTKCQSAIKERDQAKARLVETEAAIRQSANEQVSLLTNSLLEKEESIRDLLNEGEALSKKELESNNRIKKLRIKLKEVTTNNTHLVEQVSGFEIEMQKLKESVKEKETNESRLEDEVKKLEGITDSQEDEVTSLKEQLDDLEEKYKAKESTLQNTYAEITKLTLENAQKDSIMEEASYSVELRKELEGQLKELEKRSKFGKEELLAQLEDLQSAYSRLEQQLGRREDELKKEIEDLHKRLEHGEHRNQELSQSVSGATKPLLRQIGNLQNSHDIQSESWERVEKNLTERLISLQDQLSLATEKEMSASEIAIEAKSKLKAVQMQQSSLKEEKCNLQMALEKETDRCKEIEIEWKMDRSNYEDKFSKLKKVTKELEEEKNILEEQLNSEKIKYENDILRMSTQLSLQQHSQQQGNSNSRQSSRSSSVTGDMETTQNSVSGSVPLQRYLSSSSSIHEGMQKITSTTTASSVENLKCQLRSREGEVFVLQEERKGLEKTKASLAQELVTLANRVEELEPCSEKLQTLQEEYANLQSRYNAVLQMYGEKAEEADELKMDLEDVKIMYRQQIQELCGNR